MKNFHFCFVLIAFLAWTSISADDLPSQFEASQASLDHLKSTRSSLNTAIEDSNNEDRLYIPIKVGNDWTAVPFEKNDMEALLNIWIIWENESAQQATANAQSIIDFSSNYRNALAGKLKDVEREIEIKSSENKALSLKLEKARREGPLKSSTVISYTTPSVRGPQPKTKADMTVAIENVKASERTGYKKWDFEWVFTEHNGISVTLTSYELYLHTSVPGSDKEIKDNTNIRIEGGHVFRSPGYMSIEIPDSDHKEETNLHAQLHAVYRGIDDNSNSVTLETYFFQ